MPPLPDGELVQLRRIPWFERDRSVCNPCFDMVRAACHRGGDGITADVWQDLGSPTVGGGDDMLAFFKAGRLHIPCGNGQSVALPAMPGLMEH